MRKLISKSLMGIFVVALISSCSSSNEVASNRTIQKRKYNKGFFVSHNKKTNINHQKVNHDNKTISIAEVKKESKEMNVKKEVFNNTQNISVKASDKKLDINANSKRKVKKESALNNSILNVTKNSNLKNILTPKKTVKKVVEKVTKAKETKNKQAGGDMDPIVYYLLAFLIPFLAVGLVTDWDVGKVLLNLLLTLLCVIPGIIHAFIVVSKNV